MLTRFYFHVRIRGKCFGSYMLSLVLQAVTTALYLKKIKKNNVGLLVINIIS